MPGLGSLLTAIITPFDGALNVDEEAFVTLLHHLCANGSDGVVVAGSTGEAATLTDDEHVNLVELACKERPSNAIIVAGAGSNDTRHATHLTERCTTAGADAILSVTPYYNRPNARGLTKHYEAIASATDKPVILYNIPSRSALDIPNDLLAELAQIERVDYVKQANADNLAPVDGLQVYAGNDDMLADVLDMGGPGGICVASHVVGPQMRRLIDEPENRQKIDRDLQDVYAVMGITTNPIPVKAALNLLGHRAGGLRLPLVEADKAETEAVRAVLDRYGLLTAATP